MGIESATVIAEQKEPYSHGYSDSDVIEIKTKFKALQNRVEKENYKPTLAEFTTIVIPHVRIHRTEEFCIDAKLSKEKKEKIVREPKEKVQKVKKLTKKEKAEKLQIIAVKMAKGIALTDEEWEFFSNQNQPETLL